MNLAILEYGGRPISRRPFEFACGEAGVILLQGGPNRRIIGQECLQDDAAGGIAAAGAAGDLGDQLEGALGGAEIGEGQGGVAADDADQRDVGIIQALGDHLRAEHHLHFAAGESRQRRFVIFERPHGIAVDAGEFQFGDFAGEFLLDALGAQAEEAQFLSAGRAFVGEDLTARQ